MGKVENYILENLSKNKRLHFSLIDPDPAKLSIERIVERVKSLEKIGTHGIMVGGSTNVSQGILDTTVTAIKSSCNVPVILFPNGAATGISKYADAIFFMSLLNSKDPLWITKMQSIGAPAVKKARIEPIPMAYLIIEPGMKVSKVGKADLIKRDDYFTAARYALASQYMGFRFVYLEAGSGANFPVYPKMIRTVKDFIDIPLIVGGGIRSREHALEALVSGADIIVTGTIIENDFSKVKEIIDTVNTFKFGKVEGKIKKFIFKKPQHKVKLYKHKRRRK